MQAVDFDRAHHTMAFVVTKKRGTGVNIIHNLAIIRKHADGTMFLTESTLGCTTTRLVTDTMQDNPYWFIIITPASIEKSATVRHVLECEAAQLNACLDDSEKTVRLSLDYTHTHRWAAVY